MKHTEYQLQKAVCSYLSYQYPSVLFMSDTIANIKLTIPQKARNKAIQKNGFACPDLLILQPSGEYYGLFIELKAKNIYKKDGTLYKSDHLENQQKTINELNDKGYYSCFSVGYEETIKVIDWYFSL